QSGLTEGTVVTAPAHVEFETTDVAGSMRIESERAAMRPPVILGAHSAEAMGMHFSSRDGAAASGADKAASARSTTAPSASAPALPPEQAIASGVRACVASQLHEAQVRVTVSSTLSLKVAEDGSVYFARFNPPLSPEAQECASHVIYKTRFTHGGDVEIPLSTE
ncbi:MAG TPA: hypothetical protein VNO21_06570, partial [Polyangiaceae bacterium]|nr:hypothetical protein [Polyangiaceae bacterium]